MKGFIVGAIAGLTAWWALWLSAVISYTPNGDARWIFFISVAFLPVAVLGIIYAVNDYDDLDKRAKDSDSRKRTSERLARSVEDYRQIVKIYEDAYLKLPVVTRKAIAPAKDEVSRIQTQADRRENGSLGYYETY